MTITLKKTVVLGLHIFEVITTLLIHTAILEGAEDKNINQTAEIPSEPMVPLLSNGTYETLNPLRKESTIEINEVSSSSSSSLSDTSDN